jgi:hypothetical protein
MSNGWHYSRPHHSAIGWRFTPLFCCCSLSFFDGFREHGPQVTKSLSWRNRSIWVTFRGRTVDDDEEEKKRTKVVFKLSVDSFFFFYQLGFVSNEVKNDIIKFPRFKIEPVKKEARKNDEEPNGFRRRPFGWRRRRHKKGIKELCQKHTNSEWEC